MDINKETTTQDRNYRNDITKKCGRIC